jgi:hypothetical protein
MMACRNLCYLTLKKVFQNLHSFVPEVLTGAVMKIFDS